MAKNNKIIIYTDGSSLGNPGPGGFGAVILFVALDKVIEIGEAAEEEKTTNNRMEITAAIEALLAVADRPGEVTIYTDSEYVLKGITIWIHGWMERGWKNAQKKAVLNQDLWQRLLILVEEREKNGGLIWKNIRGHAGILGNERADTIATSFAEGHSVTFASGTKEEYEKIFGGKLDIV